VEREEPLNERAQLLDVNIVVIPSAPITQVQRLVEGVNQGELQGVLSQPITLSQALTVDPARGGTAQSIVIESMRSQKSVTVSPQRLEVHDLSGRQNLVDTGLAELAARLFDILAIGTTTALGFNYEMAMELDAGQRASQVIADRLIAQQALLVPEGVEAIGGGVKLFLRGINATYTIAIEPRQNDINTPLVWSACNCNTGNGEIPDVPELQEQLQHGLNLQLHVIQTTFVY